MEIEEVISLLRQRCEAAGSVRAWAEKAGVSAVYVGDVLNGRREPGPAVLKPLGLELVKAYRKVKHARGDVSGDKPTEVEAWAAFVRAAKAAAFYVDQWEKIKFSTEWGTVYVSIGREDPYPDSFDEV